MGSIAVVTGRTGSAPALRRSSVPPAVQAPATLNPSETVRLRAPRSSSMPATLSSLSQAFALPAAGQDSLQALLPALRAQLLSRFQQAGLSQPEIRGLGQALALAEPAALQSLSRCLQTTPVGGIRRFAQSFLALTPPERQAALNLTRLLLLQPQPADLRARLTQVLQTAPSADRGIALGRSLNTLGLYLPALNSAAPGVEDASGRLRQVVMGAYRGADQQGYVRDLLATARSENFELLLQIDQSDDPAEIRAQLLADGQSLQPPLTAADLDRCLKMVSSAPGGSTWAEDNKWLTGDGTVVTLPDADQALARLARFVAADTGARPGEIGSEGHHTAGQDSFDPEDLIPHTSTQGAVSGNADSYGYRADQVSDVNRNEYRNAEALAQVLQRPERSVRFYNEGGNMLVGSLPNGQPYAVIGRDGLIVSAFQLETAYAARPASVPEFAPAKEAAAVAALGLNQPYDKLAFAQQSLIDQTVERLQASGEFFRSPAAGRSRAVQFLARLELSKDVFAADLHIPREQLVFVAQPEFHIDMHLRPLAPGQIMINDFDANDRLLAAALAKATPDSWEAHELQSMRQRNRRTQEVMEPVMRQIEAQLTAGGLEVLRAPGVMQGLMHHPDASLPPQEQVRHVNFMNAIPATRPGSHQQIYLTNYTSLAPLRAAYADYLRSERGIDTIHWIGVGGGETTKSPSELSLDLEGGLDCRENH